MTSDPEGRPVDVTPSRRPTMAEVAQRAGVSAQTVSRVTNGGALVSADTAERVHRAIAELGYRPNATARALKARRSNVVGIITSDTTLYGPSSLLLSTERAVRAAGYFVALSTVSTATRELVVDAANRMQEQGVEGLIVLCSVAGELPPLSVEDVDVPTVLSWHSEGGSLPAVGLDQITAARAAVAYLLDLGHRAVVHVSGPPTDPASAPREEGWRLALQEHHRPAEQPFTGDWSASSGYDAGLRIAERDDITAVFAANDQMALGVIRALTEAGRNIPGDVSVVGFDDLPDAAYFSPPLTTVHQDFPRMGSQFVETLRRQLDHPDVPARSSQLQAQLVIRRSSGPPRTAQTRMHTDPEDRP